MKPSLRPSESRAERPLWMDFVAGSLLAAAMAFLLANCAARHVTHDITGDVPPSISR